MENQNERKLFEVFSVSYGKTGKSKGWKVQGKNKVYTAKTKVSAFALSAEMKKTEQARQVKPRKKLTAKEIADACARRESTSVVSGMKPMVRYFYLMGRTQDCTSCGKTKSLKTFSDKVTWEVSDTCSACKKKVINAQNKAQTTAEVEEIVLDVLENSEVLKSL